MNVKILGGFLTMGLLAVGCGGTTQEPAGVHGPAVELTSQEQALAGECKPGYTAYNVWDCEPMCTGYGNALNRYCTNGSDEYKLTTVRRVCGACY